MGRMAFETARARNLPAMHGAVKGWINDAHAHPEGARLLRAKADWIEAQLRALSRSAELGTDTPEHLEGLTAPDLIVAHGGLLSAADRLQKQTA